MHAPLRGPAALLAALALVGAGARAAEGPGGEVPLSLEDRKKIMQTLLVAEDITQYQPGVRILKAKIAEHGAPAARFVVERGLGSRFLATHLVAAEALARAGRTEALDAFEDGLLHDVDYNMRRMFARLLVGFGDEATIDLLLARQPDFAGKISAAARALPIRARAERMLLVALDPVERFLREATDEDEEHPERRLRAQRELERLTGITSVRYRERRPDEEPDPAAPTWPELWRARTRACGGPPPFRPAGREREDAAFRITLIQMLALLRSEAALEPIARRLRHPSKDVRVVAANALGRIGGGEAVGALRRTVRDSLGLPAAERREASLLRAVALNSLTRLKGAGLSAADLAGSLASASVRERRAAVRYLASVRPGDTEPALLARLAPRGEAPRARLAPAEGDPLVRWEAVAALGRLGTAASLPALADATQYGDRLERAHVYEALRSVADRLRPAAAPRPLLERLALTAPVRTDREPHLPVGAEPVLRDAHARLLAVMEVRDGGATRLLPLVAALAGDPETPVAVAALRSTARLGEALAATRRTHPALLKPVSDTLPGLRRALRSDRAAVAAEAAETLAALKDRSSAEEMIRLLGAPRLGAERFRVFRALRTLTGKRLPNEPELWATWWREKRQASSQREGY